MEVVDAANCLASSSVVDDTSPSLLPRMEGEELRSWGIVDIYITGQLRPPVPLFQHPAQHDQCPAYHAPVVGGEAYVSSLA